MRGVAISSIVLQMVIVEMLSNPGLLFLFSAFVVAITSNASVGSDSQE